MYALKKTPATEQKIEYQCQQCFTDFCLIAKDIRCPNCDSQDLSQMVLIYMDDDAEEIQEMFTKADWRAGD